MREIEDKRQHQIDVEIERRTSLLRRKPLVLTIAHLSVKIPRSWNNRKTFATFHLSNEILTPKGAPQRSEF